MTAGPVNRALLESNFQNPGDVYSDLKTEGAFDVVADQIDDNWDYTTSLVANGTLTPYPSFLSRQAIINGNFDVWQRGTSGIVTTDLPVLLADRWRMSTSTGGTPNLTQSRQTLTVGDIPNSYYHHRLTTDGAGTVTAGTFSLLEQPIENGNRLLAGNGKKVTVSFYARSSIAGKKMAINLTQEYGTGGSPSAAEQLVGTVYSLTSTWTKYTFTFTTNTLVGKTFGTNNDDLLRVRFWQMWGSNFQSRFGASSTESFIGAGNIDIAQVQVNAGDTTLLFQPKSYEDEIISCGNPDDTNVFGYNQTARPSVLTYPVNSLARQAIINGNFDVWQRGTSFTNPANGTYTADRYRIVDSVDGGTDPTLTHSRAQLNSGELDKSYFLYRISPNGSGSGYGTNAQYMLQQRIENGVRNLCGAGKKITITLYARSNIAGKRLGINAVHQYGTGGSPSTFEILTGQIVTLTAALTKYTVTLTTNTLVGKTFGTNNDDFLSLQFYSMWGTTTASTAFGGGTAETFGGSGIIDIAQVQVNSGDVALPFQPRSFAEELSLCLRYYEKSFPYATAPVDAALVNGAFNVRTQSTDSFHGFPRVVYKASKRISPTVTLYNPAVSSASKIYNGTDATSHPSAVQENNELGFRVFVNSSSIAAQKDLSVHWIADSEL